MLTYYAIANASAYTQDASHRRWPRALNVAGLIGCVVLVVTLPVSAVIAGLVILAIGLSGRALSRAGATRLRARRRSARRPTLP